MKILLVEDDDLNRNDIEKFLHHDMPNNSIEGAASFQSAHKALLREAYDVVLLDMTIPTLDKGRTDSAGRLRHLGGADLLDQMHRRGIVGRIIVVTGYDRLGEGDAARPLAHIIERLRKRYPHLLAGAIFYSRAEEHWKDELRELMHSLHSQGGSAHEIFNS